MEKEEEEEVEGGEEEEGAILHTVRTKGKLICSTVFPKGDPHSLFQEAELSDTGKFPKKNFSYHQKAYESSLFSLIYLPERSSSV